MMDSLLFAAFASLLLAILGGLTVPPGRRARRSRL